MEPNKQIKPKRQKRVYLSRDEYIAQIANSARLYIEGKPKPSFNLSAYMDDINAMNANEIWRYAWAARNPTERVWKFLKSQKGWAKWEEKQKRTAHILNNWSEFYENLPVIKEMRAKAAAREATAAIV